MELDGRQRQLVSVRVRDMTHTYRSRGALRTCDVMIGTPTIHARDVHAM